MIRRGKDGGKIKAVIEMPLDGSGLKPESFVNV